jgi:hypothetical protein
MGNRPGLFIWPRDRLLISTGRQGPAATLIATFSTHVLQTFLLLNYLIYLTKFIMYCLGQVAGQIVWRQLSLKETTSTFMINLQNHRQCPAGGFNFGVLLVPPPLKPRAGATIAGAGPNQRHGAASPIIS